jgi:metal-dependent amidase/aminoacylase/carboxypeptidase family protein
MTAGTAFNIIPSEAVLEGTVRHVDEETRAHIKESIVRIATLTAQSLGASATVEYHYELNPTISTDAMVDLVAESAARLLGKENVVELPTTSMGGEDFSFYLEKIPGAFFRMGTVDERPDSSLPLHNSHTLFSERAIVASAVTMCGVVYLFTGSDFSTLL